MNNPDMHSVKSSNVAALGYDADNQMVYVRFQNGTLYTYSNVPEHEYEALNNASSIGSYLHRNFKNVYPYQRIE
ncbi:MAG: KTSC domain-containing protein [Treponema sp.]|nr:KTSC domain-containing protein [Treponema sp.]